MTTILENRSSRIWVTLLPADYQAEEAVGGAQMILFSRASGPHSSQLLCIPARMESPWTTARRRCAIPVRKTEDASSRTTIPRMPMVADHAR